MSTYLGRTIVTPPSAPWPASLESVYDVVAAANENPFTLQQQVQDWGAQAQEISVSFASMTQAQAQAWIAFLKSCRGVTCVFQFASALAAAFPESLTTDGTNQPYWCLKDNGQKWSVRVGVRYGLTFECRQAL